MPFQVLVMNKYYHLSYISIHVSGSNNWLVWDVRYDFLSPLSNVTYSVSLFKLIIVITIHGENLHSFSLSGSLNCPIIITCTKLWFCTFLEWSWKYKNSYGISGKRHLNHSMTCKTKFNYTRIVFFWSLSRNDLQIMSRLSNKSSM